MSNYLAGRDSNRGECVQACRWKYEVRAEGASCPVEEDARGTYIFNSKDLNLIGHLKELSEAGVDSFKIEGRMKSAYYLATVVNAYRRAFDRLAGKPSAFSEEEIFGELKKCAHRDFTTAYALGENEKTVNYADLQTKGTCDFVAEVKEGGERSALVEMRNRFRVGETLEILSPTDTCNQKFVVDSLCDAEGNPVEDAKLVQQTLRIGCPYLLRAGDILRRPVADKK